MTFRIEPHAIEQEHGPFTFPGLEVEEGNLVVLLRESEIVFNENGVDIDFRVESDNHEHALFVRGSDGKVGVATSAPFYDFQIGDGADVDRGLLIHAGGSTGKLAKVLFKTSNAVGDSYIKGGFIWEDTGESNARGRLHLAVDMADDAGNVGISDALISLGADIVFNEAGIDRDFRVETADRPDILYTDGEGAGFAAIGTTTQALSQPILTIEDDTVYSVTGTVAQAGVVLKTAAVETGTYSTWFSYQFTPTSALTDLTLNMYMDPEVKTWSQYDPTKIGGAIYQQWIDNDRVRHQWYTYITGSFHLGAEYDVVLGGQTTFIINATQGDCDTYVRSKNLDDTLFILGSADQVYIGGKSGLDDTFQFGIQQRAADGPLALNNAGFVLGDVEGWGGDPLFSMQYLDYAVGGWQAVLGILGMNLYHDNSTDNWVLPDASQDGAYFEMISRTNTQQAIIEAGYALATGGVAALIPMLNLNGGSAAKAVIFNEFGHDHDLRIETSGNPNMVLVDGGNDELILGHGSHPTGGAISADEKIWISKEDDFTFFSMSSVRDDGTVPLNSITGYAARGTNSIPTGTMSGDLFMIMGARGHIGTEWGITSAFFSMQATEDWGAANKGTDFVFEATPAGSAARGEQLRLGSEIVFNGESIDLNFRIESDVDTHSFFLQGSDGFIGIGHPTPYYHLVLGDGAAGAYANPVFGIRSASDELGTIAFGDADAGVARYAGYIEYSHVTGDLSLGAENGVSVQGLMVTGSGVAFPGSPAEDDLYYREDLQLMCVFDGTRWVTVNEYVSTVASGVFDVTVSHAHSGAVNHFNNGIVVTAMYAHIYTDGSHDGTDHYTVKARCYNETRGANQTSAELGSTDGLAAGWRRMTPVTGQWIVFTTQMEWMDTLMTKVNNPTQCSGEYSSVYYRIIIT